MLTGLLGGVQIIESIHLTTTTTRVVKHTRKWKRHGWRKVYTTVPNPNYFVVGGAIYAHPVTAYRLRRDLEKQGYLP
jgi:hypothetical protein